MKKGQTNSKLWLIMPVIFAGFAVFALMSALMNCVMMSNINLSGNALAAVRALCFVLPAIIGATIGCLMLGILDKYCSNLSSASSAVAVDTALKAISE